MKIYHREKWFSPKTGEPVEGGHKLFSHFICDYCGAKLEGIPAGYDLNYQEQDPEYGTGTGEGEFEARFAIPVPLVLEGPFVFCGSRNCGPSDNCALCELKMAAESASSSPQNDHWLADCQTFGDVCRAVRIRMLTRELSEGRLTTDELNARTDNLLAVIKQQD